MYPYLSREVSVIRLNQFWAMGITYISVAITYISVAITYISVAITYISVARFFSVFDSSLRLVFPPRTQQDSLYNAGCPFLF